MKTFAAIFVFLLTLAYSPPAEACGCRVIFEAELYLYDLFVRDVYGVPYHCSSGAFSFHRQKRIVQLQWLYRSHLHIVNIFLPLMPVVGKLPVSYCWGDETAMIGPERIPVVLTHAKIYIVKRGDN